MNLFRVNPVSSNPFFYSVIFNPGEGEPFLKVSSHLAHRSSMAVAHSSEDASTESIYCV